METGEASGRAGVEAPDERGFDRSWGVEVPDRAAGLHDPETGLLARDLFADRLAHALARAERRTHGLALLLLRIDQAAEERSDLDLAARAEIVRAAAGALRALVRRSDTLARLSAGEFAILLEEPRGVDDVRQVCAGLMMALGGTRGAPSGREHIGGGLSASIGIALLPRAGGGTAQDLLRRAARARDEARLRGGACYVISSADAFSCPRV